MDKLLLYPGVLALIAGVFAYVYQLIQKWSAVSAILETEINHLLGDARENLDFLDRPSHYWLTVGNTLKTAPKAFLPKYRVFDSIIKDLYILGRHKASKVLAFYEYHALCENLRQSLFEHIAALKDAKQALTQADVTLLHARLERCCDAYKGLDRTYPQTVTLQVLRSKYQIPSTENVKKALT
jgi:hypothetical protein